MSTWPKWGRQPTEPSTRTDEISIVGMRAAPVHFDGRVPKSTALVGRPSFDDHAEVAVLRTKLDEIRAQFDELRAVSLARQRAQAELVGLHCERAIQRARAAERDASTPLH